MRIVYLGACWIERLEERFKFDRPLPRIKRRYPFGAELVIGLADAGHHVSVIIEDTSAKNIEVFRSVECDVYTFPGRLYRYQFPTLYYKEVGYMRQCIEMANPDVCVANWTYQFARAAVTSGHPSLVIARDSAWRCLRWMKTWTMLFKSFYAQLFVFPKIKHLSTISPHMVEDLRRLNRYKGPAVVIPNGIPESRIREGKVIRAEAKEIVCVSEWNRLKNTQTLMRAFAILKNRYGDWKLRLIGNHMDARGAMKWAKANNVPMDGIEFMGLRTQAEISKILYEDADVFCSPTLEESFGQVFLEAMSQGVPCVGGEKSGAVPWLLGEGKVGVLTDVKDAMQLADALEKLMLNKDERGKRSRAGIDWIRENFLIKDVVARYVEELEKIAKC